MCSRWAWFIGVLLAVVIATIIGLVIHDNTFSSNAQHYTSEDISATLTSCQGQLEEMKAELKSVKHKLGREEKAHKKLKEDFKLMKTEMKRTSRWVDKMDNQCAIIEKAKDEVIAAKDESMNAFRQTVESKSETVGAVQGELRVVRDQLSHIKSMVAKIEEAEPTVEDKECTGVLCSGLKVIKASVDAAIGQFS